jgi:polysaccharide export outer membrane protein
MSLRHPRIPSHLIGIAVALALTFGAAPTYARQTSPAVNANVDSGIEASTQHPVLSRRATTLEAVPEDFANAPIAPGYLLAMDVFDVPDFSGLSLRVDPNGNVSIPSAGMVHVAGDTVSEAQAAIQAKLVDQQILVRPQVQLNVLQYASGSVSVLGEVQSPGRIQMLAPRSLADVLALAGGETIAAGNDIEIQQPDAGGAARVLHVSYTQEQSSSKLQRIIIHPGDSVFVHKAGVLYVLGAVTKPGGYLMVNGGALDVLQALSLAGGTTLEAAMGGIRIYRPSDGTYREVKVHLSRITKGEDPELKLQLNDVLYVPRSKLKTTLVDGSYLVGSSITSVLYRAP